jgi:hypothetical protein
MQYKAKNCQVEQAEAVLQVVNVQIIGNGQVKVGDGLQTRWFVVTEQVQRINAVATYKAECWRNGARVNAQSYTV